MLKKIKFNSQHEWLELRRNYIGSSNIATLNGTNPYQSLGDLYNNKINNVDQPINERMRWGIVLEDSIAKEWAFRNNRKVKRSNYIYVYGDIIASTIDRFDDLNRIVEIKNLSSFAFNNYKKIAGIPAMYYDQMQAQMLCTGKTQSVFVALINNGDLYEINLDFNYDYAIELFNKAKDFYDKHLKNQIPPKDIPKNTQIEIKDNTLEGTDEDYNVFNEIKVLDTAIKELNEKKQSLIGSIKNRMNGNSEIVYNGEKLFYYNSYYQFNSKQFQEENPELYESYKNQLITKFNIGR